MRIWTPKKPPCNPRASHLQSLSDAIAHRNRFRFNPLAKVGSLFVPQPLRFAGGYPCCCGECGVCECSLSDSETVGCCISVTISGMGGSGGDCSVSECANYNDTYTLYRTTDVDSGDCHWICDFIPEGCDSSWITLRIYQDGANYKLRVTLGDNDHIWEKTYASKPNLCSLLSEILPHLSDSFPCDSSSSTCSVTMLTDDSVPNCGCICNFATRCSKCEELLGIPPALSVTINGVSGDDGCVGRPSGCQCTDLDDTYILNQFGSICRWDVEFPFALCNPSSYGPCDVRGMRAEVLCGSSDTRILSVFFFTFSSDEVFCCGPQYEVDFSCETWSVSVPPLSFTCGGTDGLCCTNFGSCSVSPLF